MQEPVMWSGTLRENVDPLGKYDAQYGPTLPSMYFCNTLAGTSKTLWRWWAWGTRRSMLKLERRVQGGVWVKGSW
jgi:hypothetical protein